jgi:hypothetical protein
MAPAARREDGRRCKRRALLMRTTETDAVAFALAPCVSVAVTLSE